MKKLAILILFAINISAYSQGFYSPGYIIKLNGDTVKGYVLDNVPMYNCQYCLFKNTSDSKPIQYKPNEILAYRFIGGKYYVSRDIKIDSDTTSRVFLQWLILGRISVYSYLNSNTKIRYFAENEKKQLVELKNTEKDIYDEYNDRYRVKRKEYIGILNYLTGDCAEMKTLVSSSTLNDKSLINVARIYTEKICKDNNCVVFEKPKKRGDFTFSIVTGYSIINDKLDEISLYAHNAYTEKSSALLGINLCFSNFDYVSRRLAFESGIYFYTYNLKINTRSSPELIVKYCNVPVIIDYSLLLGKLQPIVSFGTDFIFTLSENNNNIYSPALSSHCNDILIGAGLKYQIQNKYTIQANTTYALITEFPYRWVTKAGKIFSMQFKFGYSF